MRYCKKEIGEYSYYFDPLNTEDMAIQISSMIINCLNGILRPYESVFNFNETLLGIDLAFSEIRSIRCLLG